MKAKFNLLFFFSVLLLANCRNSEENIVAQNKSEPASFYSYLGFFQRKQHGEFMVESYSGMWGEKGGGTQFLRGFFTDRHNRVKGGKVTFGNYVLSPEVEGNDEGVDQYGYQLTRTANGGSERHAARALFGKTMAIRLEVPDAKAVARGEGYTTLTDSLYVPMEIEAVAPVRVEGDSATFVIQEGFNLRWNVDHRNMKGVIIYLQYAPDDPFNYKLKDTHPKAEHKVITVKDVPEGYVFKNSDLSDFPNQGMVTIRLGRANYVTLKNGDKNYNVAAFTMCHGIYIVKVK